MMDYIEKRRHPRVILISPVRISSIDSAGENKTKEYQGLIRNISISGLGIESYEILPVGGRYIFTFSTGNFFKIKVKGEIKWSAEAGGKRLYGIEFLSKDTPILTRIKINLLVRRLSSKSVI